MWDKLRKIFGQESVDNDHMQNDDIQMKNRDFSFSKDDNVLVQMYLSPIFRNAKVLELRPDKHENDLYNEVELEFEDGEKDTMFTRYMHAPDREMQDGEHIAKSRAEYEDVYNTLYNESPLS